MFFSIVFPGGARLTFPLLNRVYETGGYVVKDLE